MGRNVLNELALFSGCGGGILAAKLLGWRTVCAVEIEKFRAERLAQRQNEGFLPPFPIWNGDIANFDGKPWRGIVDVVSGGFPCQDISAANPFAQGIAGARSGLWKEMFRIICEAGPNYVLVENSPMLAGRGLGVVLGDLAGVGFDARWGVLGADDLGGFHRRKRLFIVAWKHGVALGHTNRERLEGQSRNGDGNNGPDEAGHTAASDIRVLANSSGEQRRTEHEQQIREGRGPREQFGGSGDDVANGDRPRELQSQGGKQDIRGRTIYGGSDCLWLDRELIQCTDGKIRATKPGLCGMADGVANRVDRISAIGDGQVPVVVAAAWNILACQS